MFRKVLSTSLTLVVAVSLLLGAAPTTGPHPDEVMVRYPAGTTKLLVADLARLTNDPALAEAVMAPLAAARHPLNGVRQVVEGTLGLPTALVSFVAHGTGPGISGLSLIQGPPSQALFGPLFGLQFAVGAPRSPFTNSDLTTSNGRPLMRTGGNSGPVQIQWGYAVDGNALLVGTETSFGPPPNVARLEATMAAATARANGVGPSFDELLLALNARGCDLAFVRATNPAQDRPAAPGEQAASASITLTDGGASVFFDVRFATAAQAAAALAALNSGASPYLAQDLYQGELVHARVQGNELKFTVNTDLTGLVGLLLVLMPN